MRTCRLLAALSVAAALPVVGAAEGGAASSAFPGLNGRIVFVRITPGATPSGVPLAGHALYTVTPTGADEKLLLDGPGYEPAWSPDGAVVVYAAETEAYGSIADRELFVFDPERPSSPRDPALRQLTFDSVADSSPSWSPDGSRIAYVRGGDVWLMRSSGTRGRLVARGALSVAWSPDGRWLALTIGDWIEVVRPDGRGRRRVARAQHYGDKFGLGEAVEWTPDSRIVFVGDDNGVWTVRHDGTERRRVRDAGYQLAPSPDGRLVAAKSWAPPQGLEVFSVRVGERRALTSPAVPASDHHPDWQPVCSRRGGSGPDAVLGTVRDDLLCGLAGPDDIDGRAGLDRIFGGIGDDVLRASDGAFDVVGCGPGVDLVVADRRDLVGVDCERVRRG